ncbi:MAG: GGDEF domain-containing protein, partial [Fervidobacterium sp.]
LLTITPLSFFILVAVTAPFIAKRVIQPLHDIEYAILNHTPDSLERYVYLKNEIGELAQAIKSYLNQKEQINLYLKELESKNASLRALNEEVRRLLEKDPLTGLLTRRVFNEQIERLYVSSKADRIPLSAISIDADNFKKVNDTYGHATGDEVLKSVGEVILKNVRLSDFPIRMGGEEILILLPQADVNAAYSIAERIRKKVEETFENKPYKVTISLGVTQLKGEDSIETFLRRVDDALYISKSNGKNRTTIL